MKLVGSICAAALLLSGCGAREELKPAKGAALPVAPIGARVTPTSDQLLQAPAQMRPSRSDNIMESSEKRRTDEFDLPPPN